MQELDLFRPQGGIDQFIKIHGTSLGRGAVWAGSQPSRRRQRLAIDFSRKMNKAMRRLTDAGVVLYMPIFHRRKKWFAL